MLSKQQGGSVHFVDLPIRVDPESDDLSIWIAVFNICDRFAQLLLLGGVISGVTRAAGVRTDGNRSTAVLADGYLDAVEDGL